MQEVIFQIRQEADAGYTAEALGVDIFTQAETWKSLRDNVCDAVQAFFFDTQAPDSIRLQTAPLIVHQRSID